MQLSILKTFVFWSHYSLSLFSLAALNSFLVLTLYFYTNFFFIYFCQQLVSIRYGVFRNHFLNISQDLFLRAAFRNFLSKVDIFHIFGQYSCERELNRYFEMRKKSNVLLYRSHKLSGQSIIDLK